MRPGPRPCGTPNTCSPRNRYAARRDRSTRMTMTMNRAMTDGLIRGYLLDEDRRAANDDGILTFTATSAGVKRDGLNLDPTGGQWENFMRNPVFLWVHDYWGNTLPIGRVNAIGLVDTK